MVRHLLIALLLLITDRGMPLAAATKPSLPAVPKYRIPLEKLGFRPVTSAILQREAYSMSTVDFIDNEHVLLTFNARKLVHRQEEDREGEQARLLRAVVLHLPDGKVVRETEWRTHDHSRYLWPLREGKFLLRVRNELYLVRPLAGREGMERLPLLQAKGEIEALQVSPSGEMVLVETSPERHVGDDPTEPLPDRSIRAAFYRVINGEHPGLRLQATVNTEKAFYTAFSAHGFLTVTREDREHWGFDFHPFVQKNAKPLELAGLLSTCQPRPEFLSETTFLATGCRGGEDRRLLAGFDLNAEANWVVTTDDGPVWQAISSAPAAGRFALRTTMLTQALYDGEHVSIDEVRGQEVRVFSFRNGTEILRATSHPVQRTGQSFSLSADGMSLVVLHDSDLDVYALPPMTEAERKFVLHEDEPLKLLHEAPETESPVEAPVQKHSR